MNFAGPKASNDLPVLGLLPRGAGRTSILGPNGCAGRVKVLQFCTAAPQSWSEALITRAP